MHAGQRNNSGPAERGEREIPAVLQAIAKAARGGEDKSSANDRTNDTTAGRV